MVPRFQAGKDGVDGPPNLNPDSVNVFPSD
jgi:hypothetical protein